jgi:hypothetical protein
MRGLSTASNQTRLSIGCDRFGHIKISSQTGAPETYQTQPAAATSRTLSSTTYSGPPEATIAAAMAAPPETMVTEDG